MQRVPVKGTPLRVAHYAEADLFAVLASRQVGCYVPQKRRTVWFQGSNRAAVQGMHQLAVLKHTSVHEVLTFVSIPTAAGALQGLPSRGGGAWGAAGLVQLCTG